MSTIAVVLIIVIICLLAWWLYSLSRNSSANTVTPISPAPSVDNQDPKTCIGNTIVLCQLYNKMLFNERLMLVTYLTKQNDPNYQSIWDSVKQRHDDDVASFSEFIRINYPDRAAISDFISQMQSWDRDTANNAYARTYALYNAAIAGNDEQVQQISADIKNLAGRIISGLEQRLGVDLRSSIDAYMDLYVEDIKAIVAGDWVADTEYTAGMFDIAYGLLSKIMGYGQ